MAIDDPILEQTADDFLGVNSKRESVKEPVASESIDKTAIPDQEGQDSIDLTSETPEQDVPTLEKTVETNPLAEEAPVPPETPADTLGDSPQDIPIEEDFEGPDTRPMLDFTNIAQAKDDPEAHAFLKGDEAEKDFFGPTIWGNIKEVGNNLIAGASVGAANTAEMALWVSEHAPLLAPVAPIMNFITSTVGGALDNDNITKASEISYDAFQSFRSGFNEESADTGLGEAANLIGQFGVGLFGAGKFQMGLSSIVTSPKSLGNMTKVSLASMLGFDEHTENLGNALEKFPELKGVVTEYFGKKDDDGLILGRVKNLVDIAVGGIIGKGTAAVAPKVAATISSGFTKGVEALKYMAPWGWKAGGVPKTYLDFADDIGSLLPPTQKKAFMEKMKTAGDITKGSADMIVMQMQSFLTTASHAMNILGNTSMMGIRLGERAVARGITILDKPLKGVLLGGETGIAPGEVAAMWTGIVRGAAMSIKEASSYIEKRGVSGALKDIGAPMKPQTGGTKLDYELGAGASTLKVDPNSKLGKFADAWGNWVINPNFKALGKTDDVFRRMNYFAEYNAQVTRHAYNQGFRGADLDAQVLKYHKKPPAGVIEAAMQEAKRNVFQADPEYFGKAALAFRNTMGPLGKGTVPFFNTLNNITKEKFQRFPPTALLFREARKDLGAGGVQRADRLAKINTGMMFLGTMWGLDEAGIFTADVGAKDRPVTEAAGTSEYSVKVGDKSFGFKDLDVTGGLMRLSLDFKNLVSELYDLRGDGEDKDIQDVMAGAALLMAAGVTDSTWGESIVESLGAIMGSPDDKRDINKLQRFAENKAISTAVPNVIRRGATALDQHMREAQTFLDKLKTTIPGLAKDLPIKYDVYGRERTPTRQGVTGMLSPIGIRTETEDKFDNFLLESEIQILPPTYTQSFSYGPGETAKLGLREHPRIYSEMNRLIGELPHPDYDEKTLSQYLEQLATGDDPESQEFRDLSNGPDGDKQKAVRAIISDYRAQAREHLLENDPELKTLIDNEIRTLEEKALLLEKFNTYRR